ncbi:MAG: hypothetical protein WDW38_001916 [Sanguina aurantia]
MQQTSSSSMHHMYQQVQQQQQHQHQQPQQMQQQQYGMAPQQPLPGFNNSSFGGPQSQPTHFAAPSTRTAPPSSNNMSSLLAQLAAGTGAFSTNNVYSSMTHSGSAAQGLDAATMALTNATALAQAATAAVSHWPSTRAPPPNTPHGSNSQAGTGSTTHHTPYTAALSAYKPGVPSALRSFLNATAPHAPSLNSANAQAMTSFLPSGRPAAPRGVRGRGRGGGNNNGSRAAAATAPAARKRKPFWDGSDDSDGAAVAAAAAPAAPTAEDDPLPADGSSASIKQAAAVVASSGPTGRRKAKGGSSAGPDNAAVGAVKEEAAAGASAGPAASEPAAQQQGKAAAAKVAKGRRAAAVAPVAEAEDDSDVMLGCYRCQFAMTGCPACRSKPFVTRPVARWQPKEGRMQQNIPAAPTYYPTAEEFKDPFAFIASIRPEASNTSGGSNSASASADPALQHPETFRFWTRKQFTSHLCMRGPARGGGLASVSHAAGRMGAVAPPPGPAAAGKATAAAAALPATMAVSAPPPTAAAAAPVTTAALVATVQASTVVSSAAPAAETAVTDAMHCQPIKAEPVAVTSAGGAESVEPTQPGLRQIFASAAPTRRNGPPTAAGASAPGCVSSHPAAVHMVQAAFPVVPPPAVLAADEDSPCMPDDSCHPPLPDATRLEGGAEDGDGPEDQLDPGAVHRARARRSAVARELNALGMDLTSIDESVAAAVGGAPGAATSSRRRVASLKAQLAVEGASGDDTDHKRQGEAQADTTREEEDAGLPAPKRRSTKAAAPAAAAAAAAGEVAVAVVVPEAPPVVVDELGSGTEEDTFGFLSSERQHTLRSFSTYASWAKALHFELPLAAARRRNNDMLNSAAAGGVVSAAKAAAAACLLSSAGDQAAAAAASALAAHPTDRAPFSAAAATAAAAAGGSPVAGDSSCRPSSSSEGPDDEMSDQPEAPGHNTSVDSAARDGPAAAAATSPLAAPPSDLLLTAGATPRSHAAPLGLSPLTVVADTVSQSAEVSGGAAPWLALPAPDSAPAVLSDPAHNADAPAPAQQPERSRAPAASAQMELGVAPVGGATAAPAVTDCTEMAAAAAAEAAPAQAPAPLPGLAAATPVAAAAEAAAAAQSQSLLQAQAQLAQVQAALAAAYAIQPAPPAKLATPAPKQPPMSAAELAGIARSDIARRAANARWQNRANATGVPVKPSTAASIAAAAAAATRRRTPPAAAAVLPAAHTDKKSRASLAGAAANVTKAGTAPETKSPHGTRASRSESAREPCVEEIEAEFWRVVERPEPGQVVETLYGSDLDSGKHGSGFPLPPWRGIPTDATNGSQLAMDEKAREYSTHPWNVNNMPYNKGSALRYMDVDELITGVMVPWLYVGSCLSAFCWHIEDHSLYSINYLHMGAHKVWYSVPADAAEKFEAAMHDALPHLFQEDPQLLHRLVTMLAPSELMARGVPVHRVVHEAGSFVITFPNAYHCGFNCGFNCAEAVNFAPADWLPFGGNVVSKYRVQAKAPTLSFDALLIRLVSTAPVVHEAHAAAALRPPPTTTTEGGAPLKLTDGSEHATACAGHSSPASASACAAGAGRCVSREQGAGGLAGGGGGGGGSGAMGTDEQPGPESGAAADELPPPKGASRMQPLAAAPALPPHSHTLPPHLHAAAAAAAAAAAHPFPTPPPPPPPPHNPYAAFDNARSGPLGEAADGASFFDELEAAPSQAAAAPGPPSCPAQAAPPGAGPPPAAAPHAEPRAATGALSAHTARAGPNGNEASFSFDGRCHVAGAAPPPPSGCHPPPSPAAAVHCDAARHPPPQPAASWDGSDTQAGAARSPSRAPPPTTHTTHTDTQDWGTDRAAGRPGSGWQQHGTVSGVSASSQQQQQQLEASGFEQQHACPAFMQQAVQELAPAVTQQGQQAPRQPQHDAGFGQQQQQQQTGGASHTAHVGAYGYTAEQQQQEPQQQQESRQQQESQQQQQESQQQQQQYQAHPPDPYPAHALHPELSLNPQASITAHRFAIEQQHEYLNNTGPSPAVDQQYAPSEGPYTAPYSQSSIGGQGGVGQFYGHPEVVLPVTQQAALRCPHGRPPTAILCFGFAGTAVLLQPVLESAGSGSGSGSGSGAPPKGPQPSPSHGVCHILPVPTLATALASLATGETPSKRGRGASTSAAEEELRRILTSFPGPLGPHTSKDKGPTVTRPPRTRPLHAGQVLACLAERLQHCPLEHDEADADADARPRAGRLQLWEVLHLMAKHQGGPPRGKSQRAPTTAGSPTHRAAGHARSVGRGWRRSVGAARAACASRATAAPGCTSWLYRPLLCAEAANISLTRGSGLRVPTLPTSHPPTLPPSHPPNLPPSHPPTLPPSHPPTLTPSTQARAEDGFEPEAARLLLQHLHGGPATAAVRPPRLATQGSSMDLRAALTHTFLGAGGSLIGRGPAVSGASRETLMQQGAARVEALLVRGLKAEALQEALSAQLWGPALVLAQSLGPSAFSEAVVAMTSSSLQPGFPLHTWSLVTAGRADLVLLLPAGAESSSSGNHPTYAPGGVAGSVGAPPHVGMTHLGSSAAPWGAAAAAAAAAAAGHPAAAAGNGHALPPGCFLPPMPAATSACGGYAPASSNHGTSASSKSSLLLQWRQHAAVLLGASRAGAPEAARCSQALSRLGEQLKRLPGQHLPSHMCYLLAGRPLNFLHQEEAGYCLVGADPSVNPRTYCSVLALQRSEILEWSGRALSSGLAHATPAPASSFGSAVAAGQGPHADGSMGQLHGTMGHMHGSAAGNHGSAGAAQQGLVESNGDGGASSASLSLPLLPYKLWYAHMLAEAGKVSEAVQYCQAIEASLRGPPTNPHGAAKPIPASLLLTARHLEDLRDRLAHYTLAHNIVIKTNESSLLRIGRFLDRAINNIMGGEGPRLRQHQQPFTTQRLAHTTTNSSRSSSSRAQRLPFSSAARSTGSNSGMAGFAMSAAAGAGGGDHGALFGGPTGHPFFAARSCCMQHPCHRAVPAAHGLTPGSQNQQHLHPTHTQLLQHHTEHQQQQQQQQHHTDHLQHPQQQHQQHSPQEQQHQSQHCSPPHRSPLKHTSHQPPTQHPDAPPIKLPLSRSSSAAQHPAPPPAPASGGIFSFGGMFGGGGSSNGPSSTAGGSGGGDPVSIAIQQRIQAREHDRADGCGRGRSRGWLPDLGLGKMLGSRRNSSKKDNLGEENDFYFNEEKRSFGFGMRGEAAPPSAPMSTGSSPPRSSHSSNPSADSNYSHPDPHTNTAGHPQPSPHPSPLPDTSHSAGPLSHMDGPPLQHAGQAHAVATAGPSTSAGGRSVSGPIFTPPGVANPLMQRNKANVRSRYVDTFNPSAAGAPVQQQQQHTSSLLPAFPAAPLPQAGGFFTPSAPSSDWMAAADDRNEERTAQQQQAHDWFGSGANGGRADTTSTFSGQTSDPYAHASHFAQQGAGLEYQSNADVSSTFFDTGGPDAGAPASAVGALAEASSYGYYNAPANGSTYGDYGGGQSNGHQALGYDNLYGNLQHDAFSAAGASAQMAGDEMREVQL